ncbi:MAG: phosphoserine phosphatase SerB [Micrococcales bacterium]|nr:phosphoserine phosphatase SerB [Micrococcales bacterium]
MSILVVMDVDSTLIQQEVIELLADFAGVMPEVKTITEQAMSGELDFKQSLERRVGLLEGLSDEIFQWLKPQIELTPGVQELITAVHGLGGKIGAVSGGFSQVLEPLANEIGLDYWMANSLEVLDGKLTGCLVGPVIDAEAKATALRSWATESGISIEKTIAIGDGANDIPMLKCAGYAVAFRPKPILKQYADLVIEENSLASLIGKLGSRAG